MEQGIVRVSKTSQKNLVHHYAEFDPRYDFRNTNLVRFIASLVKGKTVLDVGSGSGFLLNELNKKGKIAFGIEPVRDLIEIAKKRYPSLALYQGHAEDIEKIFPHNVDAVIMTDVLEHIEDDKTQIIKLSKKLHLGGQIIIVVPAYQFLYGKRDIQLGHYRRYSAKTLSKILKGSGFQIINLRYWNMLGILPYFISEKILGRPFNTDLRAKARSGIIGKTIRTILNLWFKYIENNLNFGFGLSLVCVAEIDSKRGK